jgi:hypothetical protein
MQDAKKLLIELSEQSERFKGETRLIYEQCHTAHASSAFTARISSAPRP